jgi:hypothetical protein
MVITPLTSGTSEVGMAGIPAVLWRVTEGKTLPLDIKLAACCRYCGARIDVLFKLANMDTRPERLRCALCTGHDMKLLSAVAVVEAKR